MDQINQIVILDNGAYTIKVGFYTDLKPKIVPNCTAKVKNEKRRIFICDQIEECKDYSGMFYFLPFNKGYLLNFEMQRKIWDHIFGKILKLPTDSKNRFSTVGLLITEPVYNFQKIRREMIKILFEEYGFAKILITSSCQLAAFNYLLNKQSKNENNCLIVDSGYSFTHIVPFVDGYKISTHMKRIDIGGKALTNHLKEIISYRQINVLDETYVINQMKEDCCYISTNFWKDLINAKKNNNLSCDYVLPDFNVYKRGFVLEKNKHIVPNHCQSIRMNNERFQVPELLFNPSDINIDQFGISATIIYAIEEFDSKYTKKVTDVQTTRERAENLKYIESDDEEIDENEKTNEINSNNNDLNNDSDDTKDIENDNRNFSIYDENIQAHLYSNILLIGGNCLFSNFKDRIYNDIRVEAAQYFEINVEQPPDPIIYAWQGGCSICKTNDKGRTLANHKNSLFHKYAVSREEYFEKGAVFCCKKMSQQCFQFIT